jgi:hypothetical protein
VPPWLALPQRQRQSLASTSTSHAQCLSLTTYARKQKTRLPISRLRPSVRRPSAVAQESSDGSSWALLRGGFVLCPPKRYDHLVWDVRATPHVGVRFGRAGVGRTLSLFEAFQVYVGLWSRLPVMSSFRCICFTPVIRTCKPRMGGRSWSTEEDRALRAAISRVGVRWRRLTCEPALAGRSATALHLRWLELSAHPPTPLPVAARSL